MASANELIVLVGSNPLPCYIALIALKPERAWLIHTEQSQVKAEKIMGKYKEFMQREDRCDVEIEPVLVDADDGESVQRGIDSIPCSRDCGLNFTGGTKLMAVHAYRAWASKRIDNRLINENLASYIDHRENRIVFGMGPRNVPPKSLNDLPWLDVRTVIELHGCTIEGNPSQLPKIRVRMAKALLADHFGSNERRQSAGNASQPTENWESSLFVGGLLGPRKRANSDFSFKREDCPMFLRELDMMVAEAAADPRLTDDLTLAKLVSLVDQVCDCRRDAADRCSCFTSGTKKSERELKYAKWIEGGWLEDYVTDALRRVVRKWADRNLATLDEEQAVFPSTNLKTPKNRSFELDTVLVRGCIPYVVSCTTADNRHLLKEKLIEVQSRANLIGGDQARYGLVTLGQDRGDLEELSKEITRDWNDTPHHKVFGYDDLQPQFVDGGIDGSTFESLLEEWLELGERRM